MNNAPVVDPLQILGQVISATPWPALILLMIGFATWFIGGHIIMVRSLRRRGEPGWSTLLPSSWMRLNFSGGEWGAIGVLMLVSMGFLMAGLIGAQGGMTSNNELERPRAQRGPSSSAQEMVRPAAANAPGRPAQQDR